MVTMVLAAVLFEESPSTLQVLGCVLVLFGAGYAARSPAEVAPVPPVEMDASHVG